MKVILNFAKSKLLRFMSIVILFFASIMIPFSSAPVSAIANTPHTSSKNVLALATTNNSASAATSTQNFTFSNFAADYYLEKLDNGTSKLHVKEILTAEFPSSDQNHGITREIPLTNQDGTNIVIPNQGALNLSVLRNGQPEPYSIEEQSDIYLVKIGDAGSFVHGTQTYTLEYDFYDVITEFDNAGNNVSGHELKNPSKNFIGTPTAPVGDKVSTKLVQLCICLQIFLIKSLSNPVATLVVSARKDKLAAQLLKIATGTLFLPIISVQVKI